MGLLSGGLNGRRFRVTDPLPHGFRDVFKDAINENAFVAALDASDDEPRFGWVDLFEPANTTFELNTFLFDRYLALSLRTDKKTVNGRFFKIALTERFEKVKEMRDADKLSKTEKKDVEETLKAELLARALPSVSTAELAWDVNTGEVILFTTSESVVERLQNQFEATFDMRLRPERMCDWVQEKLGRDEVVERTERYLPDARGSAGNGTVYGTWHEDDPFQGFEQFLASDFLTWLWLQSEEADGHFRVIENSTARTSVEDDDVDSWNDITETLERADLTLWLEGKLKLQDLEDPERPDTTILLGVAPTTSDAARTDLHGGKRPVETKLGMKLGDLEIGMTLVATDAGVAVAGLKIPCEVKSGTDELIFEKMALLDLVHSTLKKLFQQFFLDRTSEVWEKRLERWISENDELAAK